MTTLCEVDIKLANTVVQWEEENVTLLSPLQEQQSLSSPVTQLPQNKLFSSGPALGTRCATLVQGYGYVPGSVKAFLSTTPSKHLPCSPWRGSPPQAVPCPHLLWSVITPPPWSTATASREGAAEAAGEGAAATVGRHAGPAARGGEAAGRTGAGIGASAHTHTPASNTPLPLLLLPAFLLLGALSLSLPSPRFLLSFLASLFLSVFSYPSTPPCSLPS